jgi:hypothetical protein
MEKHGFVYIWFDRKHKRYYIGCRWGQEDDGYVCSSNWMKQAYGHRPKDFKRRIIKTNIQSRKELYEEEQRYLSMIKPEEIKNRYYNLNTTNNKVWHKYDENIKTIGQKISTAKKGKSTGPCSPETAKKISEAKKKKFAERGGMTEEHKAALRGIKKKPHTEEWKAKNSNRMKEQWSGDSQKKQAVSAAAKKRWEEFRKAKQLNKIESQSAEI